MKKQQLGQFFTTNSDYIFEGLEKYVKNKDITDPFVGAGDLIIWAKKHGAKKVAGYDIDPNYVDNKISFPKDSLKNPEGYKFVLTNPPYLNVNKANKETKTKYFNGSGFEDLYQISLASIMNSEEGIVIVPINFLSAENSEKIRKIFFSKFRIVEMNYFKHQVFPDTTYNVIAFYYKKNGGGDKFSIKTHIYPDKKIVHIDLSKNFGWTIGGEFIKKIQDQSNVLGVYRLTDNHVENGSIKIWVAHNHIDQKKPITVSRKFRDLVESNLILLRAIDSGTESGKIKLENIKKYNVECLVSKPSSRNMIYSIFEKSVSPESQLKLIDLFNEEINDLRDNYLSLFLTNFRDNDRKRISFDFVYKMINKLYSEKINLNIIDQAELQYNSYGL